MILKGFGISLTRNGPDSLVQANFFLERVLAIYAALKKSSKTVFFCVKFLWFQNKNEIKLKKENAKSKS